MPPDAANEPTGAGVHTELPGAANEPAAHTAASALDEPTVAQM